MRHRFVEMLASESTTTAATKTIDINVKKPISRIDIRFKGTNSSSTPTAHPAVMVSKIELVDGSDVLYSLSGVESWALSFYEEKELPFAICEYEDNIQCCANFHLNFGRWLWDKLYALDPKRFSNLQLKITHNKALGGSAPDAGTMAIHAFVFEDNPPAPKGFLMSKEIKSYTLTASAHEYTDLPRDYPYRSLLVMSHSASNSPNNQYANVKLSIDNDSRVMYNDVSTSELLKALEPEDKVVENFAGLGTGSAVTYYICSSYENYGIGIGRSASQTTLIVAQPSGSAINVTNDASESFGAHVDGYAPFGALDLLPYSKKEEADFFLAPSYGSIVLDLTAGSGASGTVQIIVQQARTY